MCDSDSCNSLHLYSRKFKNVDGLGLLIFKTISNNFEIWISSHQQYFNIPKKYLLLCPESNKIQSLLHYVPTLEVPVGHGDSMLNYQVFNEFNHIKVYLYHHGIARRTAYFDSDMQALVICKLLSIYGSNHGFHH